MHYYKDRAMFLFSFRLIITHFANRPVKTTKLKHHKKKKSKTVPLPAAVKKKGVHVNRTYLKMNTHFKARSRPKEYAFAFDICCSRGIWAVSSELLLVMWVKTMILLRYFFRKTHLRTARSRGAQFHILQ